MDESRAGRVLVVGMGVSGIATAARLWAAGWSPVIVERAPGRRSGGYFVALFGAGQAAAQRLGMLEHLHDRSPDTPSVDLDRAGRRRPGMSFADAPGKPWMMLRGDAEQAAFATLPADVEIRYSTVPTAIVQDDDGVEVTLLDTASGVSVTERFDLVVGADGLRSTVRRLVFGPHEDYLQRMNYMIAAFEYPGTPSGLAPGEGASLLEPDRAMSVFAFADHNPTVLLTYRTDDVDAEFTGSHADRIREVFGPEPLGATLGDAIAAFDSADGALFDSVEQVHMDTWHRGRVVLVGDSAWCVTLYAGMGVSSGLTGAELLGTVLERHPGDIDTALGEWEQTIVGAENPVMTCDYSIRGRAHGGDRAAVAGLRGREVGSGLPRGRALRWRSMGSVDACSDRHIADREVWRCGPRTEHGGLTEAQPGRKCGSRPLALPRVDGSPVG